MPPSTQKKIRDLERLKNKLINNNNNNLCEKEKEEALASNIEAIDAKIVILTNQKEDNKKNENKIKEQNKLKRKQSNEILLKKQKQQSHNNNNNDNTSNSSNNSTTSNTSDKVPIIKKSDKIPTPTPIPIPPIENDPFFINPISTNNNKEEKHDEKDTRKRKAEELYVSVDNINRYSQNSNYVHKRMLSTNNGIVDRLAFIDTSKMTKQELRLHQWKMREFAKQQSRTSSVFGGMDFHKENNNEQQEQSKNKTEQKIRKDKQKPEKSNKRTPSINTIYNKGKIMDVKTNTNSNNNTNAHTFQPKAKKSAINSNIPPVVENLGFGGVSASAITENVKNKQKGSIVQGQGKKMTFE